MVNRPKNIGTAAETAVVRAARRLGFPNADRLTLTGANDRGDVGLCPGVILEVKGGQAAKTASDLQILAWLRETERERMNGNAIYAFLITQRTGVGAPNAHRWWAWLHLWQLTAITLGVVPEPRHHNVPVRLQYGDLLDLLRANGYGEPIDQSEVA